MEAPERPTLEQVLRRAQELQRQVNDNDPMALEMAEAPGDLEVLADAQLRHVRELATSYEASGKLDGLLELIDTLSQLPGGPIAYSKIAYGRRARAATAILEGTDVVAAIARAVETDPSDVRLWLAHAKALRTRAWLRWRERPEIVELIQRDEVGADALRHMKEAAVDALREATAVVEEASRRWPEDREVWLALARVLWVNASTTRLRRTRLMPRQW